MENRRFSIISRDLYLYARVREGTSVNFGQNLHILGHNLRVLRGRTSKCDLEVVGKGYLTINLQTKMWAKY
jgi:hypothetical protein